MKNGSLIMCLFVLSMLPLSQARAMRTCRHIFSSKAAALTVRVDGLQSELWRAARSYVGSGQTRNTFTGQLIDTDVHFLRNAGITGALTGGRAAQSSNHVVMVGRGADVFGAFYAFPEATHFHSLGTLLEWGYLRPGEIVPEIAARLQSISPNAKVELIQQGLLQFPAEEMSPDDSSQAYVDRLNAITALPKPFIWKVSWTSPSAGRQVKWFYLNVINHIEPSLSTQFIQQLPAGANIAGILIGKQKVGLAVINPLLDRLASSGAVVWQHVLDEKGLQTFHQGYQPKDEALVSMLRSPHFQILNRYTESDPGEDRSFPDGYFFAQKR